MYRIVRGTYEIGITEHPNYIRETESGTYALCDEEVAQGVAYDGTPYHIWGKPDMTDPGVESVALVEVDAGKMLMAGVATGGAALLALADNDLLDEGLPGVLDAIAAARTQLVAPPVQGEEWDAGKRYVLGDTVVSGSVEYVATRYSRGKAPEGTSGYWAVKPAEEEHQAWDDIPDGTVIPEGTLVMFEGRTWVCTDQHIKSTVYRPKPVSTKWEEVQT